jgi:hypothetical protein
MTYHYPSYARSSAGAATTGGFAATAMFAGLAVGAASRAWADTPMMNAAMAAAKGLIEAAESVSDGLCTELRLRLK